MPSHGGGRQPIDTISVLLDQSHYSEIIPRKKIIKSTLSAELMSLDSGESGTQVTRYV